MAATLEHMRNSISTGLYGNGNPDGLLSNCGGWNVGIIFWFDEINFEKIDFWSKT